MKKNTSILAAVFLLFTFAFAKEKPVAPAEAKPDPAAEAAAKLDALRSKVQSSGAATEADVMQLIEMAEEQGRPYSAYLALKSYLNTNLDPSLQVLKKAAEISAQVGEFRTAVGRYKAYLLQAQANAESSDVAAAMYHILIAYLESRDDAYRHMKGQGGMFRQSDAVKKWDGWFLGEAKQRGDYKALFTRLVSVLSEKRPLEQERLHFWPYLDWGFTEMRRATDRQFEAVPAARQALSLIRGSKIRPLQFRFYLEKTDFHASSASKTPEQREQLYGKVIEAANGWIEASRNAEKLTKILHVLGSKTDGWFDKKKWQEEQVIKRRFFMDQFTKLSKEEQLKFLESDERHRLRYYVSSKDATKIIQAHKQFFQRRSPALGQLAIDDNAESLDAIKATALHLGGVPHRAAAIINSLAEGGDDFKAVLKHFFEKETWYLWLDRGVQHHTKQLWDNYVKRIHKEGKFEGDQLRKISDMSNYRAAMFQMGGQHVVQSPAIYFEGHFARDIIKGKFNGTDNVNKAQMIKTIESLDWVPWDKNTREHVFRDTHNHFKHWANHYQRLARNKNPQPHEKVASETLKQILAQVAPLEAAFNRAMSLKVADPNKAPDALCKNFSLFVLAERRRDPKAYATAIKGLYNEVKDYETKKVPWGLYLLHRVFTSGRNMDTIQAKVEILCDILNRYDAAYRLPTHEAISWVRHSQATWHNWDRIPDSYQKQLEPLNAAIGKVLIKLADQGKFDSQLFYYFRHTRRGPNWRNARAGLDVMEKLIRKKTLMTAKYRLDTKYTNPAVSYMHLVRREFTALNKKYPYDSYFDDMFIEEAQKTHYLDYNYWDFCQDKTGKVAGFAARLLAGFDTLPFGYNDRPAIVPPALSNAPEPPGSWTAQNSGFGGWHWRALHAPEKDSTPFIKKIESLYGKTRFDGYPMGEAYFATLKQVKTPEERAVFFQNVASYAGKIVKTPSRKTVPTFAPLLQHNRDLKLTKEEAEIVQHLIAKVTPVRWSGNRWYDHLPGLLQNSLLAQGRDKELFKLVGEFWRIARDGESYSCQRDLSAFAARLLDRKKYDLAAAYCAGSKFLGPALRGEFAAQISAVRAQALRNIGGAIPVGKTDPRYPVFAAQASFLAGNVQAAWEAARQYTEKVPEMIKALDPEFIIWLIDRYTVGAEFESAKFLTRSMMKWADKPDVDLNPEVLGNLYLANANISCEERALPLARAQYERIIANKTFDGTRSQVFALVKVADVDRLTKQFDSAIERLEKLALRNDKFLKSEANYGLARVKYDQEEYDEAAAFLEKVFAIRPGHATGRILEGKIHLKRKKLENATDLDVGLTASQRVLVPGRRLKVNIEDKNLSIVGKTTSLTIRAWTESGDEEFFDLTKFGDSKTKFRGEIMTALAPIEKGDGTLQVLGKDVVRYDFTGEFRKQQGINFSTENVLSIASDAELYASSGLIKTRAEVEKEKLEQMIRSKLQLSQKSVAEVALSTLRPEDQVKPGNAINIRVIDPDQSARPGEDSLEVRIATSSGDVVGSFPLKETGGHTGVFEGALTTSSAEASATASDSDEGRRPNFAISSGDHPAWVGLADGSKPKAFSADLKDNVPFGEMSIKSNVDGRHLKKFSIQTSLNGKDFNTVGRFPARNFKTWDGSLRVRAMKYLGVGGLPKDSDEALAYLNEGYIGKDVFPFGMKLDSVAAKTTALKAQIEKNGIQDNEFYVMHLEGLFYNPRRQAISFGLKMGSKSKSHFMRHKKKDKAGRPILQSRYFLRVGNIEPKNNQPKSNVYRGILKQGVHRVDVVMLVLCHEFPEFQLLSDIKPAAEKLGRAGERPASSELQPFPLEFFDSAKYPDIKKQIYTPPAAITASDDGSEFNIKFGENTRGRIARIIIDDYEGDAPAISKIELKSAKGKQVLPTQQNLLTLGRNQILEIVPGDRITVTYRDPKTVSPANDTHEALLTATYTNAQLSAAFVEYTVQRNVRTASYIPMRRFNPGDKVNVFINDADADVSQKLDTIRFTARATGGEEKQFTALETEEHSGVFIGGLFPVMAKPPGNADVPPAKEDAAKPDDSPPGDAVPDDMKLLIKEGDELIISYMDMENTDPGIPWQRTTTVEQAYYVDPEVRAFPVSSAAIEPQAKEDEEALPLPVGEEFYPVTRTMTVIRPEEEEPKEGGVIEALLEGPLLVEVLWPTVTLSRMSTVTIYAQTSTARAKAGVAEGSPFDPKVPGTMRLTVTPREVGVAGVPAPGYESIALEDDPNSVTPLDDGRYAFSIPYGLGDVPEKTFVTDEPRDPKAEKPKLYVNGNDNVFVIFKYKNKAGEEQTVERKFRFKSDSFIDVLDRRFQEKVEAAHVGETLYLRVRHRARDTLPGKDDLTIKVGRASGQLQEVKLLETYSHTGEFKGFVRLVHTKDTEAAEAVNALAVNHGDTLTFTYGEGDSAIHQMVRIHKGADGVVQPFSKQFTDPEIEVKTQFMIAEAYFELAKMHRSLARQNKGDEARNKKLLDLSRDEIAQGKKLLEEAMRSNPDTSVKAQGEYLLANLSLEFADMTDDTDQKQRHYHQAVSRFSDLIAEYPESEYAPKSQYKKALVYEKMGKMEAASEEYVKLSYRYPDNELVAETIARLGQYFMLKGKQMKNEAKALAAEGSELAGEEAAKKRIEAEQIRLRSLRTYKTAGQVFGRLAVRFPNHNLAGKTNVLAGQAFIMAGELDNATTILQKTFETDDIQKEIAATAMYWCGHAHTLKEDDDGYLQAYRIFKRLTWDYPASKWAKYARGRLTEDQFSEIEDE